jgi:hypothetical protein
MLTGVLIASTGAITMPTNTQINNLKKKGQRPHPRHNIGTIMTTLNTPSRLNLMHTAITPHPKIAIDHVIGPPTSRLPNLKSILQLIWLLQPTSPLITHMSTYPMSDIPPDILYFASLAASRLSTGTFSDLYHFSDSLYIKTPYIYPNSPPDSRLNIPHFHDSIHAFTQHARHGGLT